MSPLKYLLFVVATQLIIFSKAVPAIIELPQQGSIVPSELDALHALYNVTNGDNWLWRPSLIRGPEWDFTSAEFASPPAPCKEGQVWQGLECACPATGYAKEIGDSNDVAEYCFITSLSLRAYDLDGSLPPAITSNLTHLYHLDLSANRLLTGTIPSLDRMVQLEYLDLSLNRLDGSIPSLDSLRNLTSLDISLNRLDGSIPSLDKMVQLEYLDLSLNRLDGSIPSLDSLRNLTSLDISSNRLDGSIPSLDSLVQVEYSDLSFNTLTGSIPSLDSLSELLYLDISDNVLTGSIPSLDGLCRLLRLNLDNNDLSGSISFLDSLSELISLHLIRNDLTGPIPSLDSLRNLTFLDLSFNRLDGSIPSLDKMVQLEHLDLSSNRLNGSIPSLDSLRNLTFLNFSLNRLDGSIPSLKKMVQLQHLDLSLNRLHGSIPSLDKMVQLEHFDLSLNRLDGSIPSLDSLSELLYLGISDNVLTGSIPSLDSLSKLLRLHLDNNDLTGSIPFLDSLSELISLHLIRNDLTGPIPSLENLGLLEDLFLSYNSLNGTIPLLDSVNRLRVLYLDSNHLTGTIPSLSNMSHLKHLYLVNNNLNGTIPLLDGLGTLEELYLSSNQLDGTIPSLDSLSHLEVFRVDINNLTGPLPSLSKLSNLTDFSVNNNQLSSTIPSLDSLDNLVSIDLEYNLLTGSIPALQNLKNVKYVFFAENMLSNSIPSLEKLNELTHLSLYFNALSGSIPSLQSAHNHLRYLYLYNNALTGPLPLLNTLQDMNTVVLDVNLLTGSIPSLSALQNLRSFELNYNLVSGSIPSLETIYNLQSFEMQNNILSGRIPSLSHSNLSDLAFLLLSNNILEGSIPHLDRLLGLHYLFLSNNQLEGSIPPLSSLAKLILFEVDGNKLTGTIPSLGNLTLLTVFQVQNNQITGNLNAVFDPLHQKKLSTIIMNENQLRGTIPEAMVKLPSIQTIAMTSNCLRGPLPISSLCNSSSLRSLLLDGLHTATSCRTLLLGGLIRGLYGIDSSRVKLADQLHACIFAIPSLRVLHMSGNGLTGNIPDVKQTFIEDLVLSHHELKGTIPVSLQQQSHWSTLDLSYNRLGGELTRHFSEAFVKTNDHSSISLSLNRLSGPIPQSLYKAVDITILNGNKFSCDQVGTTLPVHDSERFDYSCGSNGFNIPYYVWLAAAGCALVSLQVVSVVLSTARGAQTTPTSKSPSFTTTSTATSTTSTSSTGTTITMWSWVLLLLSNSHVVLQQLPKWLHVHTTLSSELWFVGLTDNNNNNEQRSSTSSQRHVSSSGSGIARAASLSQRAGFAHVLRLEKLFDAIRQFTVRCWVYILVILAPLYIVCGQFSSTYTHRYAWTVCTSFLAGSTTAALLFCALTVYICVLAFQYNSLIFSIPDIPRHAPRERSSIKASETTTQQLLLKLAWLSVLLINVAVVGCANAVFVWISIYHGSRLNLFITQSALAILKYVWNSKMVHITIHSIVSLVSDMKVPSVENLAIKLQLYLAVVNNIIIPCCVVAIIDPDCFYNVLVPSPAVKASYVYYDNQCDIIQADNICVKSPSISTSSFFPPFSYSYQCSSAFTTHYATAFLYLCFVTGFVVPLWELCLMYLYSKQLSAQFALSPTTTTTTSTTTSTSTATSPDGSSIGTITSAGSSMSPMMIEVNQDQNEDISDNNNAAGNEESQCQCQPQIGSKTAVISSSQIILRRIATSNVIPRILRPVLIDEPTATTNSSSTSSTSYTTTTKQSTNDNSKNDTKSPYFDSTRHLTQVVVLLALFFTFGTVFPPLGFAIIATLFIHTYFTQFKLVRFITLSTHAGLKDQLEKIESECGSFVLPSDHGVWVLATIACWFYAFILYDSLGDTAGIESALWILSAMSLLPLVLYTGDQLLLAWYARDERTERKRQHFNMEKEEHRMRTNRCLSDAGAVEMGRLTLWAHEHSIDIGAYAQDTSASASASAAAV